MSEENSFHFSLDVPVRNEWRNIDLLRTSVQNCFQAAFSDMDGCNALAMVTGELLENAMKYGYWKTDDDVTPFRLHVSGKQSETVVTVENPVIPGHEGLDQLLDTIKWIKSFDNPGDAYRARLLEIASSEDEPTASKLGLVRVAYEGNCTLDAEVNGDTLTIKAVWRKPA